MRVLIDSYSFLGENDRTVKIPAGYYRNFVLTLSGTNDADSTFSRADAGTVRVWLGKKDMGVFTLERLWGVVNKLYRADYGLQKFSSTQNSAISAQFIIPLHVPEDSVNVVYVKENALSLQFQHSSLTSVVTALTATLYGTPELGVENYFPLWRDWSVNAKGALAEPDTFNKRNLALVSLDYSANLSRWRLAKDKKLVIDNTLAELQFARTLEFGGNNDSYADADSKFNAFYFNFSKRGKWEKALGNDFGIMVQGSDTSNSGIGLELSRTDSINKLTAENFVNRIALNDNASGRRV